MFRPFFFLLFFIALLASCRREHTDLKALSLQLPQQVRLNEIFVKNDSAWICTGGVRDQQGWIFYSADRGVTWQSTKVSDSRSVYCLGFLDENRGFAGGDYLHLWETIDGGQNWNFFWLGDQVPYHEQDRSAIRRIRFNSDSSGFFVGGENLGEGVVYYTGDGGVTWDFFSDDHEYRSLDFTDDQTVFVAGHGRILETSAGFDDLAPVDLTDDFFTCITCSGNEIVVCGYNGGIYRSENAGMSWNETFRSNSVAEQRINWNDLYRDGDLIVACGNDGKVGTSLDGGSNWSLIELENASNLYSIARNQEQFICSSDKGILYIFTLP